MNKNFREKTIYYGWVIVGVAFVTLAIAYALRYSFTVLSVAIEEQFGWSRSGIHLAYSVMITTYAFSGPIAGYFLDKYGPRKLMPVGGFLIGLGMLGCSQISHLWHLYFFYSLSAIGVSCVGTVCFGTLVSNWFSKKRGTAWGLSASGTGFGMFFIVGFFLPWVLEQYGFRIAYVVLGILAICIVVPLTAIFTRRQPQDIGLLPDGDQLSCQNSNSQLVKKGFDAEEDKRVLDRVWVKREWTVLLAMQTWRFWMMTTCIFFFTISLYAVMMHQVQHAVDVGFDIAVASGAFGIVGFLGMVGKFFWGTISDRIGREMAFSAGIFCIVIAILLFVFLKNSSQIWVLYIFAFFFGLGYGVAQPLYAAIIADIFQGRSLGAIMGSIVAIGNIGSAIGPPFAGYMYDTTGSYRVAFVSSLVCVILSAVFCWLATPRKVRRVWGVSPV